MFKFVGSLEQDFYNRYLDIEKSFKTYNCAVFVVMQSYLENLLKYITNNVEENFYLEKKETLGTLLENAVVRETLEIDFDIKSLNFIKDINQLANKYKHQENVDFDIEKIKYYLEEIFIFSKKTYKYFKGGIDVQFDKEYYNNLINEDNIVIEKAYETLKTQSEKEIIQKNEKIIQLEQEKKIIQDSYEEQKKERDKIDKEVIQLSEYREKYYKKEEEIGNLKRQRAEYELRIAEDNDSKVKELKKQTESQIKKLASENKELKSKIEKSLNEDALSEYDAKISKYTSLLEIKEQEIVNLQNEIIKLKDSKHVQKNDKFQDFKYLRDNIKGLIYSNSYIDEDYNFTIYNVNGYNLSRSKYKSFYAVVNNVMQRSKTISKGEYLQSLDLEDDELKKIIRLQMLIFALLKNNKLDDTIWQLNIMNADIKLLKHAIEDIFQKIELYTSLAKINFIRPKLDIKNENKFYENYANISFGGFSDRTDCYVIEDNYEAISPFNMWLEEKIQYQTTIKDEKKLIIILKEIFQFEKFKAGQLPILLNVLNGEHTLGILPTGGGKSLIFYFATLIQPKMTLVIAPINALIIDQVDKLINTFNITRVANITGDSINKQRDLKMFEEKQTIFTFVSPERVQITGFRNVLIKLDDEESIGIIALDEVHCLSEWGHDFRISYLMLSHTLNNYCKNIQYLGLTATASINVVKDLRIELHILEPENVVFTKNLKRENLHFEIIEKRNSEDMYNYLKNSLLVNYNKGNDWDIKINGDQTNAVVVFMKTKKSVNEYFADYAQIFPDEVEKFHGDYKDSQTAFMKNEKSLLFSTKAFGMGIDKKNIRKTIHYGVPSSRENYYQEAGRAGRDDKLAQCLMLTYPTDISYEDRVREFLRLDTDIERLKILQKQVSWKTDLSTNFYFLAESIEEPEKEAKATVQLYNELWATQDNYFVQKKIFIDRDGKELEKKLYILHKIGVVFTWSVEYYGSVKTYCIELNHNYKDIEHIKKFALKYVNPYGPGDKLIKLINETSAISQLETLIFEIRKWYHETFIRARREQLANIYDFVRKYKNNDNSEQIQAELDKFFDISSLINVADEGYSLTFDDENIEEVLSAVNDLDAEKLDERRIEMERLIESTTNDKINIYLSLINLRLGNFDTRNGLERLTFTIENMSVEEQVDFYKNVSIVYENLSKEQKIDLLECLYKHDTKKFRNVLLENISKDYISLGYYMKFFNQNLSEVF